MGQIWTKGLRALAVFELAKGLLVLLAGIGALELIHGNVQQGAEDLVRHFHLNPASGYPRIFIEAAAQVSDAGLWALAGGALVYAMFRLVEAFGLWRERPWAKWLGVASAGLYVPVEVWELARGLTWLRGALLAINLAIVAFLAWSLRAGKPAASKTGDNAGKSRANLLSLDTPIETDTSSAGRMARLLNRLAVRLTRNLWVWPMVGAAVIMVVGIGVRAVVEEALRKERANDLQNVLDAEITALRLWFQEQELDARALAADARVLAATAELLELSRQPDTNDARLRDDPAGVSLRSQLRPLLIAQGYTDFVVVSRDHRILASLTEPLIGQTAPASYDKFLAAAFNGQLAACPPIPGEFPTRDARGNWSTLPTMLVAAPLTSSNGAVVAALALRLEPEKGFSQLLAVARAGDSGQIYAVDRNGMALSRTRQDAELKALGLIPDRAEATAILNLRLADPGVDLVRGDSARLPRAQWPLTKMAAQIVNGRSGYDVSGYRDSRGVRVVGAWAWLPEYELGVATELSVAEAFRPAHILRKAFLVLFVLLALAGLVILLFMIATKRLQAAAQKYALAARRLGQYELLQPIGEGSYGEVYKARHAMLRRPVAVKLINPERVNETTVARFEREVQATSQLTHPNTVAIYDYGRTPEGIFYYAMEYLPGIDLNRLVTQFGPQAEGRVIFILRQICGALAEAHEAGLVHRDIKPANVLLTRRGGQCDTAKLLDFGLVKAVHPGHELEKTVAHRIMGTPRYLAPEAVQTPDLVDARSDLYSLGAVGYFLVTGQPVFDSETVKDLLNSHLIAPPPRPSNRLGRPVSRDLEDLLLQCLAKSPAERPPSARWLGEALARCNAAAQWTPADAEGWWRQHLGDIQ